MTSTPPGTPPGTSPGGPSSPQDDTPHDGGPRVSRNEMRDLARLRRTIGPDRQVAGVAGGVARHLDIDPAIVRVVFVVLAFFGGSGVLLYLALWLLVPEDGAVAAPVRLDEGARTAGIVAVGVISLLMLLGDTWGPWGGGWFPWPLALVAVVVAYVLSKRDPAPTSAPPSYGPSYGPPAGPVSFTKEGPVASPYAAPPPYAAAGQAPYTRPMMYAPVAPVAPRPRRQGPILFGWTLALLALGLGLLGMADVGGASVADSAYPALALGLIGTMLLIGAWFGRAGGLILIGLIAALTLAGATAAEEYDGSGVTERPQSAAAVSDRYDVSMGELRLDLSEVSDPAALVGRTIEVDGGLAKLEVILPEGIDVQVEAVVDGPGDISLFGQSFDGIDIARDSFRPADPITPAPSEGELVLDINLGVGEIVVSE
ncbi:PspC domain-containing protein [Nocardioides pacificus]